MAKRGKWQCVNVMHRARFIESWEIFGEEGGVGDGGGEEGMGRGNTGGEKGGEAERK